MKRWTVSLALLIVVALLSGCGSSGVVEGKSANAHASPSPTPTLTPIATWTPRPTPTATVFGSPCNAGDFGVNATTAVKYGDLLVSALAFQGPSYPGYQLPDNLPLAPYKVVGNISEGKPLSNPGGGFSFMICNTSTSHTHIIHRVTMKLATFASYSGQLNEVRACTPAYSRQGMSGGGCGGASAYDMSLQVGFPPSASVGMEVDAQPQDASGPTGGDLGITLVPGRGASILLSSTLPTTPGTMTFSGGIAVDSQPLSYPAPTSPGALYAPVAHKWTGDACTTSAMQSQIPPATTPPTYYICPQM